MPVFKFAFKRHAWLMLCLLCSASMYWYWSRLPHDSALTPAATDMIRAKPLTDLFQPWYASREFLLRHRDPYGPEVTREIQEAFYGKQLQPGAAQVSNEQQFAFAYRFAYPLYVVFLLAPTIAMDYRTAQMVVWWVLAAATVLSMTFWLLALRIRVSLAGFVGLSMVVVTSLPAMQGLNLRQLGLLVAGLIAAAAASTVAGHLFLAGALLALATIKPQLALLPIAWFALWALAEWRQRRALAWGFALALSVLLLSAEFLLPGWLVRFEGALREYAKYTGGASLTGMLLPLGLRWLAFAVGGLATTTFCWRARRSSADPDSFILALALVLNLSLLIMPTVVASYNQVLLLPAALLVAGRWSRLWAGGNAIRVSSAFLCTFALLPWFLVLGLAVASTLAPGRITSISLVPAYAGLGLPFASFGLLVLLGRAIGRRGEECPATKQG